MLLFCVITTGWGILHDRLCEKSGSIWVPALFHGASNAAALFLRGEKAREEDGGR